MSSKLYKTQAIFLKALKYKESSLILDAYTRERGLRSYIVSGVRKQKKGSNSALYQIMNIIDLIAYEKEPHQLSRIKEIKLAHVYDTIQKDIVKSSIATVMVECTRNAIKEHEPNQELYDFIAQSLHSLDKEDQVSYAALNYMIGLSRFLGIQPDANYQDGAEFDLQEGRYAPQGSIPKYSINPQLSQLLFQLQSGQEPLSNKNARQALLKKLMEYYQLHLPYFKPLKSLDILSVILG